MPLHPSIARIPMPERMQRLELTKAGWPSLFFAAIVNGEADLRVADSQKMSACVKRKLCWLCGQPLGQIVANVIGPMCALNRTISEPPQHYECAHYAVQACPFLSRPHARRNATNLPEGVTEAAGCGLKRNPGAVGIWVSRTYPRIFSGRQGGHGNAGRLFELQDPERIEWYCEGRAATLAEVLESIESGLPLLLETVPEKDRRAGAYELQARLQELQPLLPAA